MEPTRWQRGVRSRPDFSRASVQSPSASPQRWRVFCKGTHPRKLLNGFQSERVLRCHALVAARPTAVARAARCKDSAPGGGSAAVGPAPRPRAEARCPTRTEHIPVGSARGNANCSHLPQCWRQGGAWRCRTVSHSHLPLLDDGGAGMQVFGYTGTARVLEYRRIPPGCTCHLASWVPRARVNLRQPTADAWTFLLGWCPRILS